VPRFSRSTAIQSVLLSRRYYSAGSAREWLRRNGFRSSLDTTEHYHRVRQRQPGAFVKTTLRTIRLTKGVKAITGVPKHGR
jgi:hypothetical protein